MEVFEGISRGDLLPGTSLTEVSDVLNQIYEEWSLSVSISLMILSLIVDSVLIWACFSLSTEGA